MWSSIVKCSKGMYFHQLSLSRQCQQGVQLKLLAAFYPHHQPSVFSSSNKENGSQIGISNSIFALSSGHGKCGVSIIRVSGLQSRLALQTLGRFSKEPLGRKAFVRNIYHPISEELLDKALVLWFPGPNSFTGEDSCEFQVHGGPAVVTAVLDALQNIPGLRHAEPGEFTKRSFINGKLDLTEVEGLSDLIHAETEQQRRQAVRQMDGQLAQLYAQWRKTLLKCVANVEAYIDFSEDENIEDDVLTQVDELINQIRHSIYQHLHDNRKGERLRNGVNICILGEPNVGKSSLLNVICQRPAAIVSPIAGTTRDVVETALNIGGYPVMVGDTAGLRETDDDVEREGVRRARERALNADLRILVLDSTTFTSHEQLFESYIISHLLKLRVLDKDNENTEVSKPNEDIFKNLVVVFNKTDLADVKKSMNEMSADFPIRHVSCVTEAGIDEFLDVLKVKVASLCADPSSGNPSLTQARHRHHLEECTEALDAYGDIVNEDIVLAAHELRKALRQIGKITGKITSEEILDVVFRDFCIGK